MKNINIKRLKTALTEYWLLNRGKLVSIPVVVLVLYLLAMFWYGTPLFERVLLNIDVDRSFAEVLANYTDKQITSLVFFTMPLFLVLCTVPYFKILLKTVHGNLSPITRGERMLTLWVGNLLVILLVNIFFFVTDWVFVSVMRSIFLEEAISYKESIGDLYYKFTEKSYFVITDHQVYIVASIASFVFVSLYQLACTFFRRYSIPVFIAMMIIVGVAYYYMLISLYHNTFYHLHNSDHISMLMFVFMAVVAAGINITTYFKLREKEIY